MSMSGIPEESRAKVLTPPKVISITSLKGNRVTNSNRDDLGKIEDLMVEMESGRIAFAVLGTSGGLGRESRLYAIPWEALKYSLHDKKYILNISKETLANAPSFHRTTWPDLSDLGWLKQVYSYYGLQPFWKD